jgi:hypothetical protein
LWAIGGVWRAVRDRLAKRHVISRNLIRIWVEKYEAGALDEDIATADMLQQYEARIAALERLVGRLSLENDLLKGPQRTLTSRKARACLNRPGFAGGCLV